MAKNVELTDKIQSLITATQGEGVEFSDITVFEASIASTKPLSKRGSLIDGARMSEDMLHQMAMGLNSGDIPVPLHIQHEQHSELPIGRVFNAEVFQVPDGSTELRAMFYMGEDQADVIARINNSVIDEVSVAIVSKQMLCSECGFDFLGPDSDFDNFFNQMCCNEHEIGEDGVFIRLIGLDKWHELSLVSTGASSKPKILGRTKHRLGEEAYSRIAANGLIPEAVVLYTQMKGFEMAGDKKTDSNTKVDLSPITEAINAVTVSVAKMNETVTTLRTDVTELKTSATDVKADVKADSATDVKADVKADAKTDAETSLTEIATLKESEIKLKAEIATLKESETKLKATVTSLEAAAALKVGGTATAAIDDATASKNNSPGRFAAFKISK